MGTERHSLADRTWNPDCPAESSFGELMIHFFVDLRFTYVRLPSERSLFRRHLSEITSSGTLVLVALARR